MTHKRKYPLAQARRKFGHVKNYFASGNTSNSVTANSAHSRSDEQTEPMQGDLAKGDAEHDPGKRKQSGYCWVQEHDLEGMGHSGHNKAYVLNHTTIPSMV
jgi:hypothetical protein